MDQNLADRIDHQVAARLPYGFARQNGLLAVGYDDAGGIEIAVDQDRITASALAEARRALGVPLCVRPLPGDQFRLALERAYTGGLDAGDDQFIEEAEGEADFRSALGDLPHSADLLEDADDAPVVRLINNLLAQSLRMKASDLHIESYEAGSSIRYRKDGVLADALELNPGWHAALVSRVKVMAGLDIDVKRVPQDGRMTLRLAGRMVDVRVSTLPTMHGERVVLRVHDKQESLMGFAGLGMGEGVQRDLGALVNRRHGIILVTGPTGSGKTTTLYAALAGLDVRARNIMTVEDPIEYDLPGISQTQVNSRIEMTFARALRSILRQDPDVIMIGEIRDIDTARIAIQASLTGHLVLATLHTNDSVSAVTRLIDMGVEPFLLSSSLLGALAQRLVRRLCDRCKAAYDTDDEDVARLTGRPVRLSHPVGCAACGESGFSGRAGVFELFVVDDTLRQMIHDRAPEHVMRDYAFGRGGATTLAEDALRLAIEGVTSREEGLIAIQGAGSGPRERERS